MRVVGKKKDAKIRGQKKRRMTDIEGFNSVNILQRVCYCLGKINVTLTM